MQESALSKKGVVNMTADGGVVVGEVLAAAVLREVPKGVRKVSSWVKGRSILVVGQARSGKTSFYHFLRYGELEKEEETDITYDEKRSRGFVLRIGKAGSAELHIRQARDVPGQSGAVEHAKLVQRRRPHALVIMTDLTTPLTGADDRAAGAWLKLFSSHLADKLRGSLLTRRSLKSIIVVMNKADKAKKTKIEARRRAFKKILVDKLEPVYGSRARSIPIVQCVLVDKGRGSSQADALVRKLAKSLLE